MNHQIFSGEIPPVPEGQMRDANPELFQDQAVDEDGFVDMFTGPMKRRRFIGGSEIMGAFQDTWSADMIDATSRFDSGLTGQHLQPFSPVIAPIICKRYREGWDNNFDQFTPLFNNLKEPLDNKPGFHSVMDLPMINYFLELGTILSSKRRQLLNRDESDEFTALSRRYKWYLAHTLDDLSTALPSIDATYGYLGPMIPPDSKLSQTADRCSSGERLLSFAAAGRAEILNYFTTAPRKGQLLFFVGKEYQMPDTTFRAPSGFRAPTLLTGGAPRSLQIRGQTSDDGGYFDTSLSALVDEVDQWVSKDQTEATDLFYTLRDQQIAEVQYEFDWDDDSGHIRFRNLIEEEGVQESRDNAPQKIVNLYYQRGYIQQVGVVKDANGSYQSQHALNEALRSQEAAGQLQKLEIWAKTGRP